MSHIIPGHEHGEETREAPKMSRVQYEAGSSEKRSPEYRMLKHNVSSFKKQLKKTLISSKARNKALDKLKK